MLHWVIGVPGVSSDAGNLFFLAHFLSFFQHEQPNALIPQAHVNCNSMYSHIMVALGQPFSMDGFIVSLLTNNKSNSANNFALELHYVANSILNVFFEN